MAKVCVCFSFDDDMFDNTNISAVRMSLSPLLSAVKFCLRSTYIWKCFLNSFGHFDSSYIFGGSFGSSKFLSSHCNLSKLFVICK